MTIKEKIAAIIVLYEPPEDLGKLVETIRLQVQEVIVVDNGDNTELSDCHWLKNPDNGLAKAQNMGIAKARELKCSHVLLLDDDSMPAPNMVNKLREGYKLTNNNKEIAIIAPYIEEDALGKPPKYIKPNGAYSFQRVTFDENTPVLHDLYYVAASGSLISMDIFDHIGEMKEAFFIYFVDTEFCLRARAAGFDIIAMRDAKLNHHFGTRSQHNIFGKNISTTNHSAKSRWYMFRNRRHLWLKYFETDAGYVLFDILRSQSEALRVLLFERNKADKLTSMVKGLFSH